MSFIAAVVGANRGHLGQITANWIHMLGSVGRRLVYVPEIEYLLESMPASFQECNMERCCALGDATDFLTETVRVSYMKVHSIALL